MPIRYVDRQTTLARAGTTMDDVDGSLTGSFVPAATRTGPFRPVLSPMTAAIQGVFGVPITRTGTIGTTLSPFGAIVRGDPAPDAPSAPTVSTFGSSTITLSLPTSAASDHASYTVQRSTDGTNFGNRATAITASTWQDTGLNAETAYHYRLLDVDDSGNISAAGASVSQTTAAASAEPYNLYASDTQSRGTIPFAVNWPTAPTNLTNTINVQAGSAASLTSALSQANATINVPAGTYSGTFTITQTDQHIIFDDAATISGVLAINHGVSGRTIIEGGNIVTTSAQTFGNAKDLLVRNMNIQALDVTLGVNGPFSRVAFIQNTIYNLRTGFFTPGPSGFGQSNDLILAGNYISGGMTVGNSGVEPAVRVMRTTRAIIVDNRLRCGFDGQGVKHTIRSHYGNQDYWVRRNLTEYGDHVYIKPYANATVDNGEWAMGDHWYFDLLFYNDGGGVDIANAFRDDVKPVSYPGTLTVAGNIAYRSIQTDPDGVTGGRWRWNAQAGDSVGDSGIEYPYQSPPSLAAWQTANNSAPGADH